MTQQEARSAMSVLEDWDAVRDQFALRRDKIHMTSFLLSPQSEPVRNAIAVHRAGLDEDTVDYLHGNQNRLEANVLAAAADYLGVNSRDIALTGSTTEGLGLLYGGIKLREGQEILQSNHEHYSTDISLKLRAERDGVVVNKISLYDDVRNATAETIVDSIVQNISDKTRLVALTWVHSGTGLKIPVRLIADELAEINKMRDLEDRVLLSIDGVHGIGIEDVTLPELGCDFFVAGTHKWLYGPRGTGLVWAKPDVWQYAHPTIPTFDGTAYRIWMRVTAPQAIPVAEQMTPGGFHAFEHRWAVNEAFNFHQAIGKERVQARVQSLNRQLKEALSQMSNVILYTPLDESLSAGITCFDVGGLHATAVVDRLEQKQIVASITPYAQIYGRLAPSIINSPEEVDQVIEAVAELA
jgi:selenocysteine lyase/cysteine desulfurase